MKLEGNTFVVTGGAAGIGREVTLQLLARGAKVAAVDLSEDGLAETAKLADAGKSLSTHALSVSDRDAVATLPAAVKRKHGSVDGIINVAGIIQPFVKVNELEYAAMERVMDVNFWGVVNVCKEFLPALLERPEAAVVNVSSMGALAPVPGQAFYGASKAAVKLLTEALYAELMGTKVAVTVIFPGAIGTNIAANSGVSMGEREIDEDAMSKTTSPEEAGRVIIEAMVKGKYRDTIGSDAKALDRFSRFLPKKATETIANKMKELLG